MAKTEIFLSTKFSLSFLTLKKIWRYNGIGLIEFQKEESMSSQRTGDGGKILIVEDEESVADVMEMYIESEFDNELLFAKSGMKRLKY